MRSSRRRILAMAVATALSALTAAGCGRSMLAESAADKFPGDELELDYWQHLERQRILTNSDALHGLLLLADGTDPAKSYDERVAAAQQRGWLPRGAAPPGQQSATIGSIAVAVCDILGVRGGVSMGVARRSPRYCTRELVYMQIIPPRSDNQSLSGLEFLDLVGRVEGRMPRPAEVAN